MYKIIGIDISKASFDAFISEKKSSKVYSNNLKGFKNLLKGCDGGTLVVMESSGYYHVPLASFLHKHDIKVAVVNPLIIKRFSQMQLNRAKTDKKDAQVIAAYARLNEVDLWQPDSGEIIAIKQVFTTIELLEKQIRQASNQIEAFTSSGNPDKEVLKTLKSVIRMLEKKKELLNLKLVKLAKENFGNTLENLTSIPGIGNKTAAMLIAITNDFKKFTNYKQLIAYVGFSPRVYQSGTSVRGRGHICKMGKAQIRKLLYMCTWSAKRANAKCAEMYARLKAKGKPERVIKIAIANKLLKQMFALAKSNQKYQENYTRNICF